VPGTEKGGLVEMKILVDDKEVFSSGKIPSASYQTKALNIPLTNAKKLTLIVTDGGNGGGGDHASWADAYLTVSPLLRD
jgi:alpha-L-fucosidase 2